MWLDTLLGFISGVGVALFGAVVAYVLQRRLERRNKIESERFQIYMKLMELHGSYFGLSAAEANDQPAAGELRSKVRDLAWQIADRLRAADNIEDLDRILDVLFSTRYGSAQERYQAIDVLLRHLGETVNPRYAMAVRTLSEDNLRRTAKGTSPSKNTPGFL